MKKYRSALICVGCMLFLAGFFSVSIFAADELIDDFETAVQNWVPSMQHGKVTGCKASAGEGVGGSQSLQIEYRLEAEGETNHILFGRDVDLDLSGAQGISFQVKGVGDTALVFLFVFDSQGRFNYYGPHGSNTDFRTGYQDWHTCQVNLFEDQSVPPKGGNVDFGDIKRVGFFIWGIGPKQGTVWFDDLRFTGAAGSLWVSANHSSLPVFSPNGDGVYDAVTIKVFPVRNAALTVRIVDAARKCAATLAKDLATTSRCVNLTWDGLSGGQALPDGEYTILAFFEGEENRVARAKVMIDTTYRWPPVTYENAPFFPIGVWFEGSPELTIEAAGYSIEPVEAKQYYDRCFADLATHGFNTVTVPNCPEHLWKSLLQSAQEHGLKIILQVNPLVQLVSQYQSVPEAEVYAAVKHVVDSIGTYDSLLRYQVRDEPREWMIDHWVLIQRILAAVDPKRPAFSCFAVPTTAGNPHGWLRVGMVSSRTQLSEAVFDDYPHHPQTPLQTLGNFLPILDSFKSDAPPDIPLWAVLQAYAQDNRYPTPEELRAVTYLSLAAGAKGVFYFLYQYMPTYLHGMVKPDGTPLPIYTTATTLAQELQKLSPLLLTLTAASPPSNIAGDVRVGSFVDGDNHPVLIVASTRPDIAVTARVDVTGNWQDALSGEVFAATNGTLIVPLSPGDGRVLVKQ